jgi:hypothetical protein
MAPMGEFINASGPSSARAFAGLSRALTALAIAAGSLSAQAATPVMQNAHALLADLQGADDAAQSRARQLLPREGIAVAPELIALLTHEQMRVWAAAHKTLADLAHTLGAPGREQEREELGRLLLGALKDAGPQVQERILRLLPAALPPRAKLGPVAALLHDEALREHARAALQEINSAEAARELSHYTRSAPPDFVPAIVRGLAQMSHPQAAAALRNFIKHDDPAVRAAALRGMAASGNLELAPIMRAQLKRATDETRAEVDDAWLRWLRAIGERGGNVERLMALYRELLDASTSDITRGGAVTGLARFGDERALQFVLELLKEESAISPQLIYAIRFQQGRAADVLLREGYAAVHPSLRPAYLAQLATRHSAELRDTFAAALAEEDLAIKRAGLAGLVGLGGVEAIEPLKAAAADPALKAEVLPTLMQMAATLAAQGNRAGAGSAYLAAHGLAGDDATRQQALAGVQENPVPEAAQLLADSMDDAQLATVNLPVLEEIRRSVESAGLAERAAALEAALVARLAEPGAVQQLVDHANRTGTQERWAGKLGFIHQWHIVGPFPFRAETGFENHVAPEGIDLAAEYPAGEGQPPLKWQQVKAEGIAPLIDLWNRFGLAEHASAYAMATVTVAEETDAILGLGSDDGVRAWVNGAEVHNNNVDRGTSIDADRVPVHLAAGANTILLQIGQNGGGWNFIARLMNADGVPLAFTQDVPATEAAPAPEAAPASEAAPTADEASAN